MSRRRGTWVAGALAGVGAVALLAAGLAAAALDDPAREAAERRVQERLPDLVAFVESERGLELKRPVEVEVLSDEDFVDALFDEEGYVEPASRLGPVAPEATYVALGLVDAAEDFYATVDEGYAEGTVGFYDPPSERLVVRGDSFGAYEELVLVHELTHALQDQWFGTHRPELQDGSEAGASFSALVEGDAIRVERAWYEAQPPDVQEEIARIEGGAPGTERGGPADFDVYAALFEYSYVAGLGLVDALLAEGGQERLDQAFRQPPWSSEQVLHPELYDGAPPPSRRTPKGRGALVDQGVLGEVGLALLLGNDPTEPGGAQAGWESDRYATLERGPRLCTVARVVMAESAARDRLVSELVAAGTRAMPLGQAALSLQACG